jgi:dihydropyrimidine dehydrogenase (NAD+) subunit PreA
MANLATEFRRHQIPEPVLAGLGPADGQGIQRRARLQGGLGRRGVENAGLDPPIVNVNGPRYGAIWGADRRLLGLNNIELITDRPLDVNLREIKQVKRDWPDRAMVVSLMVPCDEDSWKSILPAWKKPAPTGSN